MTTPAPYTDARILAAIERSRTPDIFPDVPRCPACNSLAFVFMGSAGRTRCIACNLQRLIEAQKPPGE
jgi:hypothetical protein